jgi:hypothetical protein
MRYVALAAALLLSCSSEEQSPFPPGASHDERFVGTWAGKVQTKDGNVRAWKQQRRKDGTYTIVFEHRNGRKVTGRSTQRGVWWLLDGHFFEQVGARPHVYRFEWKSDDTLWFSLVSANETPPPPEGYSFEETKSAP